MTTLNTIVDAIRFCGACQCKRVLSSTPPALRNRWPISFAHDDYACGACLGHSIPPIPFVELTGKP